MTLMEQKQNYDSTFCGSLPIHLINLVQPYGVLLVLDKEDLKIVQVSENIEKATGLQPREVVGTSFKNYISPRQAAAITSKFETGIEAKVPLPLTLLAGNESYRFLSIMHAKNSYIILELEPLSEAGNHSFVDVYQQVKFTMARINIAQSTQEICTAALEELKNISDFDRLMIYQFDEDWNGTVIAELMEEGLEPYLGLRFPASDIPKQARELYFKNPYRLIPTREYTPAKIYPVINPLTHGFIDLSNCNLRSVPAVHLEYLKNMNVVASMSTAIIKDDRLWGLISCHHHASKYLTFEQCSQFELMASVISLRLASIQNKEALLASTALRDVQQKLVTQVYAAENLIAGLTKYDTTILHLLKCEGAVIVYGRKMETIGATPATSEIKDLIFWLQNLAHNKTFTITDLSHRLDTAEPYTNIASGIIVLPIHQQKGEYIIGFRPEVIETVNWGGNPNEAVNFEPGALKYHPRNSFKLWQQTVKGTSLRWSEEEVAIAESFRNFVIEHTLKLVYANV